MNSSIMSPLLAKERVVTVPMTFHKYGPFEEYPLGFKALRVLSCALGFRRNTPQLQLLSYLRNSFWTFLASSTLRTVT